MKRLLLPLLMVLTGASVLGFVAPNPHPDPDRPRIYTNNYYWESRPALIKKLMQDNHLGKPPEVEQLSGCLQSCHYLVAPAAENTEVELDLSCFSGLQRNQLIIVAKGNLNITVFPDKQQSGEQNFMRRHHTVIEKRILPGKEPFTIRVTGQIQDSYFAFHNCSSRELLAFPVQENITVLHLSFHPDDAAFDWRILERFPKLTHLIIDGADRFLHKEEFKGNLGSLTLRGCRNMDLPSFELLRLVLDHTEFQPEQLGNFKAEKLSDLEINGSTFSDISFLKRFENCRSLALCYWPNLTEIASLAELKQLRVLTINRTAVKDISPLAGLKHLAVLSLSNNRIEELSPLKQQNIRHVAFSGSNPVADRFIGEVFSGKEIPQYVIIHPQEIEWNGQKWRLRIDGKRLGNTFWPENGFLIQENSDPLGHFRLDSRSGQYDYPPAGRSRFIYIPRKYGRQYSITIKEGQCFTDFIQPNQEGITLICTEGKLTGLFDRKPR